MGVADESENTCLAWQLLVPGFAAQHYRADTQDREACHDPGGIGQPAKLYDEQPGDQRPEAGEDAARAVAERHRGRADLGRKQLALRPSN